tara:strand:- start:2100 stop:5132 length:3033 start_codon:yes stop_codon:yes gene_type:complete
MAIFDYAKAAGILNTSPNPILDVLQTKFGVPSCLLDFGKDILAALPTSTLDFFGGDIANGLAAADTVAKNAIQSMNLTLGKVGYDTNLGRFVFTSESSTKGNEEDSAEGLGIMGAFGAVLGAGAQAVVIGNNLKDQYDVIKSCIDQATSFMALGKGPSALADKYVGFTDKDGNSFSPPPADLVASQEFETEMASLKSTTDFIDQCRTQLQNINDIRHARLTDPENNPEPCFWGNLDIGDGVTLEQSVSGFGSTLNFCDAVEGPDGLPVLVGEDDFDPFVDVIYCHNMEPPVSLNGQYLFSKTGIYYDSYGGGLEYDGCISNIVSAIYYDSEGVPRPGTGVPPNMLKWLYDYNPNIGGKGEIVSWATFNKWAGTVFDIDTINESPEIKAYYDDDHFLQVLIDQRNRQVYDVSSYIGDLQASGFLEESALLSNQRQVLYSMISDHDSKIKRRKKQIEVHVILAPQDKPAIMGQIPINDFQGLDAAKLAIEKAKQEQLLFNPGECSGVVLPLCPTFIKSEIPQDTFTADEIMVPPVGVGSIISSDPDFYGTSGTVLSLDSKITTKDLAAIYNFLDADIVTPDSNKYFTINCSTSSASDGVAQIVASSVDSMFPSGVGIPYFRGVCNMFSGVSGDGNPKAQAIIATGGSLTDEQKYSAYKPYGYGRIKQGWNNIDSLLYNQTGATFEFWTHIPDLGDPGGWNADSSLSSLHRVVMGCENRGGTLTTSSDEWIVGPQFGNNTVRGLLMGFTRDCRITSGTPPSNLPADNDLTKGLMFHMSPTQAVNGSGITFLGASGDIAFCVDGQTPPTGFYGLTVDTSTANSTGETLNDCSSSFVMVTVTIDYGSDLASIYLNGDFLKSQSIASTFGRSGPPQIPSMTTLNSFNYDIQYENGNTLPPNAPLFPPNSLGYRDFWHWEGPVSEGAGIGISFTPWIIGGGYTDGMHVKSPLHTTDLIEYSEGSNEGMNFMGGKWGGKKSGLGGFLGSLKLYNRAIKDFEIANNYKAQQGFFETIRT